MRLVDLFTGKLTYLELGALILHLPPESAYRTELRDRYTDEQLAEMAEQATDIRHGPWSRMEMIAAAEVDALQQLTHVQVLRAGVKQDPPAPLRRPGVVSTKREVSPQAVAYLDRIRQRHAEQAEEARRGS